MPHLAHASLALLGALFYVALGFTAACTNFDFNLASRRLLAATSPWVEARTLLWKTGMVVAAGLVHEVPRLQALLVGGFAARIAWEYIRHVSPVGWLVGWLVL